jgi:parallel beta helix pectate lyase-like protein
VHDNMGHALWVDCDGHDNTFSSNRVYDNAGIALDDETSYHDTFVDNIVYGNGFGWSSAAVTILDSIGTRVSGNTFAHNYGGIHIAGDRRATLGSPQPGLGCADLRLTGYYPSDTSISGNGWSFPFRVGVPPTGAVPLGPVDPTVNR